MSKKHEKSMKLPTVHKLTPYYIVSIIIAVLMSAACVIGVFFPESVYPSEEWIKIFVPNDVINLALGLPALIVTMILAAKGKIMGLLSWIGAVLYVLYNYVFYLLVAPFGFLFLGYLLMVSLSLITVIGLSASIDIKDASARFEGKAPARFAAGVMVFLGILIIGRIANLVISANVKGLSIEMTEAALHIADFSIAVPLLLIGGVQLWRKKPFGYVSASPVLFMYTVLSLGLIAVMMIQARLSGTVVAAMDIVVVSIMVLICAIPYAFFVVAAGKKKK